MASSNPPELGQVLVDFSVDGRFPEDEAISAARVKHSALPAALEVLQGAKTDLEKEIKQISRQAAPDVDAWILNAKSIQEDVETCKKLANQIVRQHEAGQEAAEETADKEQYVGLLEKEIAFQDQLLHALKKIRQTNDLLDESANLASQKNILHALAKFEAASKSISGIPLDRTARPMRLLDIKNSDLKKTIHDQLSKVWSILIRMDAQKQTITINDRIAEGAMSLSEAILCLKSFKELDNTVHELWQNLDDLIVGPRTILTSERPPLRKFDIKGNSIILTRELANRTIKDLFPDIEQLLRFLKAQLPPEVIDPLSRTMMPILCDRILESWLDTAVPSNINDMVDYQKALALVGDFSTTITSLGFPNSDRLSDWVSNAPKIWLNKRRETALDWTRNSLALGIGQPHIAERIEKRMVPRDEGNHIASTGTTTVTEEWDAAWDSGGEAEEEPPLPGGRNRRSLDEERRASQILIPDPALADEAEDADDAADAWGWNDEEEAATPEDASEDPQAVTSDRRTALDAREMTLSEKYWTSSLPQPVLRAVVGIFNDGATLSQPQNVQIPVTPAAPGLFALPSLILALYRAVSPYYYTSAPGGNMYLYNDAYWLSEKFKEFVAEWNARTDLPPRAVGMANKLNPEIQVLVSFSKRAYTTELREQRTVIKDLLGGTQNFFQAEDRSEAINSIAAVVDYVRGQALLWETILPYSVWASATGALVNAIATKLIDDVFDLSDVGVDEAERIATILAKAETLDDLFLPKNPPPDANPNNNGENEAPIPMTAQFADKWMKMKFLGEVLQSNLKDVKFLWFDSDLSLYFTVEEVVEMIKLSFELNSSVRGVIREVRNNPNPKDGPRGSDWS